MAFAFLFYQDLRPFVSSLSLFVFPMFFPQTFILQLIFLIFLFIFLWLPLLGSVSAINSYCRRAVFWQAARICIYMTNTRWIYFLRSEKTTKGNATFSVWIKTPNCTGDLKWDFDLFIITCKQPNKTDLFLFFHSCYLFLTCVYVMSHTVIS